MVLSVVTVLTPPLNHNFVHLMKDKWEALATKAQVTSIQTEILFVHMNRGKEVKPHGIKTSLKNGHGAEPAIKLQQSPSITHSKQSSQVSEGLLSKALGENICSLLGGWAILQ
jgi:hypothetical protein